VIGGTTADFTFGDDTALEYKGTTADTSTVQAALVAFNPQSGELILPATEAIRDLPFKFTSNQASVVTPASPPPPAPQSPPATTNSVADSPHIMPAAMGGGGDLGLCFVGILMIVAWRSIRLPRSWWLPAQK
jgi:hypothetical protein